MSEMQALDAKGLPAGTAWWVQSCSVRAEQPCGATSGHCTAAHTIDKVSLAETIWRWNSVGKPVKPKVWC